MTMIGNFQLGIKIINSNLFDLGYHKCKCNQLLRLHRQTCEIGFCPEDLKFF